MKLSLIQKAYYRIRRKWFTLIGILYKTKIYLFLYLSYWHSLLYKKKNSNKNNISYYSSRPHPTAGIGHQIGNWISGYWYAKEFNLKYAYIPFRSEEWEKFLGFGEGEIRVKSLIKEKKYKKRTLPFFYNEHEKEVNKSIIKSYNGEKIIFLCEQDQFLIDFYNVSDDMKRKFYSAPYRKNDKIIYSNDNYNVALHIRRGDIVTKDNSEFNFRYQENDYFENVLKNALSYIKTDKKICIYLFSQGKEEDFIELSKFPNVIFCFNMSAMESFLHMVYSDLLIISKSSFSYIPALISNNLKICPKNFWHGYPEDENWIMVDDSGNFI
jgi:hypothetical protein